MTQPKIVFIHIPRTGGSSVHLTFRKMFSRKHVAWLGHDFSLEQLQKPDSLFLESLQDSKVIGGHFDIHMAKLLPDPKILVSIIREPRERVISYYRHLMTMPDHEWHRIALDNPNLFLEHIRNQQVRFLSPSGVYEEVLDNIDSLFLGLFDNLSSFLSDLGKRFGASTTPSDVPRENATANKDPLPTYILDAMPDLISDDARLYHHVNSIEVARQKKLQTTHAHAT